MGEQPTSDRLAHEIASLMVIVHDGWSKGTDEEYKHLDRLVKDYKEALAREGTVTDG